MFIRIGGKDWLLDTGAPNSFGDQTLEIGGRCFSIPDRYLGLTTNQLSRFTNYPIAGLVGVDVLNEFDVIFDAKNGSIGVSLDELSIDGESLAMTDFAGIPIIQVNISDSNWKMIFDTGAQISYFQDASLRSFPNTGTVTDFYPGFGEFQSEAFQVSVMLGATTHELIMVVLPEMLGISLMPAGVDGIISNEFLREYQIGYFPRRQVLVAT